ncbi:hypothetical protein ACHAWX_003193 [Stephanocyclus meneghinianus]
MVLYGQIVIGAPGSGKTTYCNGMQQYLRLLGRDCWVVNLDPANEVPCTTLNDNVDHDENDGDSHDNAKVKRLDKASTEQVEQQQEQQQEEQEETNNPQLPYETILDVTQDIISLDSVMSNLHLGPNGGLLYCMEYIEHHLGEVLALLRTRLQQTPSARPYLLFDLPGQIELTAHSPVVSRIASRLVRELDLRLVCVQLVDAAICLNDVSKFIGAALVCTASMMRMELPCVNVLSKMDLLGGSSMGRGDENEDDEDNENHFREGAEGSPLPFNLEFFTQCHDLHRLVDYLDSNPMDFVTSAVSVDGEDYTQDPEYQKARMQTRSSNFYRKYQKLHHELCDLVEDFGLLSFLPLAIQDAESVGRVLARIDKCNGYVFLKEQMSAKQDGGGERKENNLHDVFSSAIVADAEWGTGAMADVQEKYLGDVMFREEITELKYCR